MFDKLLILRTPGIGPVKYAELIAKFGSASHAASAIGVATELKDNVLREMERAEKLNIKYIADDDVNYPDALRAIKNHPPVITVRGNIAALGRLSVGMVGTRHATGAGMKFMSELAEGFAAHGHVVVSGMAIGSDTAAHMGALRATGDAVTIAVLAGGADYIWPLENESLYHKIMERGCIVSEMPVGFVPVATNFVQRNRWIAGLSDKLILGEADLKSGSVHTARFACEYKREVFAIPSHPSDARSAGPNALIKEGAATLCVGINDFFAESGPRKQKNNHPKNEVLDRLGMIPLSESVLAELVKKNIVEIKQELVVLELQGLVAKRDGGYVRL